ncbi:histidine triad nucleotide-binding protein [Aeromicrobium sp. PE09-221]|uniref:histidine triad nucleotide-binding protein n=1 Tax=Aeromicrobium sp. PE09-221 TaxID=1898043 RepID=UPI000B3E9D73|nr:histidine triad nucleotide-binding protein [Aeromicrobium sp. PE09-221]OUZ07258.1 histidine triad nucleotide-binding protein [Aeromicrobium sp. PE09-221]
MAADCVFCKIVDGEIPAEVVTESEHTIAFRDISPKAPVHVLVIPREHEPDIVSLAEASPLVAAELLAQSRVVARQEGYEDYNLVFNTGAEAGQSVFHAHAHVLAGVDVSKLFLG